MTGTRMQHGCNQEGDSASPRCATRAYATPPRIGEHEEGSKSMARQLTEFLDIQCTGLFNKHCMRFSTMGIMREEDHDQGENHSADQRSSQAQRQHAALPEKNAAIAMLRQCTEMSDLDSNMALLRHCTEIDDLVTDVLTQSIVRNAVLAAVAECRFCVSIADPMVSDQPLIAVSDAFEDITGYRRDEILGKNCRILNVDCDIEVGHRNALRNSVATGEPFTGVLVNRKKDGQLFFNMLDLRGLVLARNQCTGEDLWVLVGIQAEVADEESAPQNHFAQLQLVSKTIRENIVQQLASLGASAVLTSRQVSGRPPGWQLSADDWRFLPAPYWRFGEHDRRGSQDSLTSSYSQAADASNQEAGCETRCGASAPAGGAGVGATTWRPMHSAIALKSVTLVAIVMCIMPSLWRWCKKTLQTLPLQKP